MHIGIISGIRSAWMLGYSSVHMAHGVAVGTGRARQHILKHPELSVLPGEVRGPGQACQNLT